MYTIILNNKELITTVKTRLMQKENMVDKIQFLIPPTYNGIDLSSFVVTLKYVDPNGAYHYEQLEQDSDTYKDYLRFTLPVTTTISSVIGEYKIRLTIIGTDNGDENQLVTLNTDSTVIYVEKPEGFYDYVDEEDVDGLKALIEKLSVKVKEIEDNQVDDLVLDNETQMLQVSSKGTPKGDGVEISTSIKDENNDGTIDLGE